MRAHNQFYIEQIALCDVLHIDKDRENAAWGENGALRSVLRAKKKKKVN
jgi:hypothetical protein